MFTFISFPLQNVSEKAFSEFVFLSFSFNNIFQRWHPVEVLEGTAHSENLDIKNPAIVQQEH